MSTLGKPEHSIEDKGKIRRSFFLINAFIKTQLALIAGSFADFLVTILLVQVFNCWYLTGNAAGNVTGAIFQFILSRNWVFNKNYSNKIEVQVIKFVIMWGGNIALSALLVYLFTRYIHLHYLLSKLIASVLLGTSYTYLLSKKFVFAR